MIGNNKKMKKILVTGAFGYVGSRLIEYFNKRVPDVSIRLMSRRESATLPAWAKGYEPVHADLSDNLSVAGAVNGIDTIIHLAAVNEIVSQDNPVFALDINVGGTLKLLQAAREHNVRRFIYLSTFHVYGPNGVGTVTEETMPFPVHPYSITHRGAEDFVNFYRYRYGMETLIFRLSNGYGYPVHADVDRWTLVFNDLCRQAVTECKLTLKTSGTQTRDFISLEDVVRAIYHIISLPADSWGDGLFNLGGECVLSILEIAEKIAMHAKKRYGTEIPICRPTDADSGKPSPPPPLKFSIEKLKKTGFALTGDMDREIELTLDFCESLLHSSARK